MYAPSFCFLSQYQWICRNFYQSQLTDKICRPDCRFLTAFPFPKAERERELHFIWNSMRGFFTVKKIQSTWVCKQLMNLKGNTSKQNSKKKKKKIHKELKKYFVHNEEDMTLLFNCPLTIINSLNIKWTAISDFAYSAILCKMSDVSFGGRLCLHTVLSVTVISAAWINLLSTMGIKAGDQSSLAITFQRSRVTVFNCVKSFIKPLLVDRNNYLERKVNE